MYRRCLDAILMAGKTVWMKAGDMVLEFLGVNVEPGVQAPRGATSTPGCNWHPGVLAPRVLWSSWNFTPTGFKHSGIGQRKKNLLTCFRLLQIVLAGFAKLLCPLA